MLVSMRDVILICVCIISITYAEVNGSKTVCGGRDAEFFCDITETIELHIIIIQHNLNEIGRYSTDTGVEVYQKFKDHYLIVKNMFDIQVYIRNVNEEDNGTVSCTVIYKTMEVQYQWSLIIQARLTSSVIDFKIKIGDPCTVLTCSAKSNQLVFKKPDNKLMKGTNIVLDSCQHFLPPGEFTCCLMTNCSEAVCNKIVLEDFERVAVDSKNKNWMVVFSATVAVICLILFIITSVLVTRLYKKGTHNTTEFKTSQNSGIASGSNEISKRRRLHFVLRRGQRKKSTHYQKDGSVRSYKSKSSKSSQSSHYSDNLSFISENKEQIPMVSITRNITKEFSV